MTTRDSAPSFARGAATRSCLAGNLVRRKSGPGFAVCVDVPASALAVGDYELALKGIAADRTSQDVGYYYFGVQKR
jgi:hypothetical protein